MGRSKWWTQRGGEICKTGPGTGKLDFPRHLDNTLCSAQDLAGTEEPILTGDGYEYVSQAAAGQMAGASPASALHCRSDTVYTIDCDISRTNAADLQGPFLPPTPRPPRTACPRAVARALLVPLWGEVLPGKTVSVQQTGPVLEAAISCVSPTLYRSPSRRTSAG